MRSKQTPQYLESMKELENSSPWKTLQIRKVYENDWIEVFEDQVITPRQLPGLYGRVCMKNLAIGIVPVDKHGYTWLVGQYRYTLNEYSWEIPMGGGHPHETPLEAAQRELAEETGLIASQWQPMPRLHTSNSITNETGWIFAATDLSEGPSQPDETELLQIKRLPLETAVEMAQNGGITDALSVIGLLRVRNYLST